MSNTSLIFLLKERYFLYPQQTSWAAHLLRRTNDCNKDEVLSSYPQNKLMMSTCAYKLLKNDYETATDKHIYVIFHIQVPIFANKNWAGSLQTHLLVDFQEDRENNQRTMSTYLARTVKSRKCDWETDKLRIVLARPTCEKCAWHGEIAENGLTCWAGAMSDSV